jgi:hypothetical protein
MNEPPLESPTALGAGTASAAFAWTTGVQFGGYVQSPGGRLEPAEAFGAGEASLYGLFGGTSTGPTWVAVAVPFFARQDLLGG